MTGDKRSVLLAALGAAALILLSVQVALPKRRRGAKSTAVERHVPLLTSMEEGVIRDGHRVVQVSGPFGDSCLVTLSRAGSTGEFAFMFPVERGYSERGVLSITTSRIAYHPDQTKYSARAFSASRAEVARFNATPTFLHARLPGLLEMQVQGHKYSFQYCTVSSGDDPKGTPKEVRKQHDRLAEQANNAFAGWLTLAVSNFGDAIQRFRALTANAAVPLSGEQQAAFASDEGAGDSAAQAGKLYDALHHYEAALQVLPTQYAPQSAEQPLREKIIKLVLRMNPKPAIPQDALRHEAYAEAAIHEAETKGPGELENAVGECRKALRLAPWWAGAYYNASLVLEKAHFCQEAAQDLQLYLLAKPNAPNAQSVQMKVYTLQYEAKDEVGGIGGAGNPEYGATPPSSPLYGIDVQNLTPSVEQQFALPRDARGVVISRILKASAADKAGLRAGDVIADVNRKPVTNSRDFYAMANKADTNVLLIVIDHNGRKTYVVLGSRMRRGKR